MRGIEIIEEILKYADTPYVKHLPNGETLTRWEPFGPEGPVYWVSDTIQEIGDPNG